MEISRTVILSFFFTMLITSIRGDHCRYELSSGQPIVNCTSVNIIDLGTECDTIAEANGDNLSGFVLSRTNFVSLPEKTTGRVPFQRISITFNKLLSNVHPFAFESSKNTVTEFEVQNSPELLGNGVFEVTAPIVNIKVLILENVGLRGVPAGAFDNNRQLTVISLSQNEIEFFHASLANLNLDSLDLSYNSLAVEAFSEDVFKDIGTLKELDVSENKEMNILRQNVFERLLDTGTVVRVGWSRYGKKNYMKCIGQNWLCVKNLNDESYKYQKCLPNYVCGDIEGSAPTIFEYCDSPLAKE